MSSSELNELNRDIGALSAQVRIMAETLIKMERKLEGLEQAVIEARGGWKYLTGILFVAGSVGGLVATLAKFKFLGGA